LKRYIKKWRSDFLKNKLVLPIEKTDYKYSLDELFELQEKGEIDKLKTYQLDQIFFERKLKGPNFKGILIERLSINNLTGNESIDFNINNNIKNSNIESDLD